jgi:hypothetical protein
MLYNVVDLQMGITTGWFPDALHNRLSSTGSWNEHVLPWRRHNLIILAQTNTVDKTQSGHLGYSQESAVA